MSPTPHFEALPFPIVSRFYPKLVIQQVPNRGISFKVGRGKHQREVCEDLKAYIDRFKVDTSRPHDLTVHYACALHLFSGPKDRDGGFKDSLYDRSLEISSRGVLWILDCVEVDIIFGLNLLNQSYRRELRSRCESAEFFLCVAGIPCGTHCKKRFDCEEDGYARPVRLRECSLGRPREELSDSELRSLVESNGLTYVAMQLCAAVFYCGGEVLIENPPDFGLQPGDGNLRPTNGYIVSPHEPFHEPLHAPLWVLDLLVAFICCTRGVLVAFDQCCLKGSKFKKQTWLFSTQKLANQVEARFSDLRCARRCTMFGKHEAVARGRVDGKYISAAAAAYPIEMNQHLAAIASLRARDLQRSLEVASPHASMLGLLPPTPPSREDRWDRLHAFRDALHRPSVVASCRRSAPPASATAQPTILDHYRLQPPAKRARP